MSLAILKSSALRLATLFASLTTGATAALALPIGYGYNQGDLEFHELRSANFSLYFDRRAPDDARLALRSLEAARPHMERWFGTKRDKPLIVNISAASSNASFANFITDSIELQTMGQGGRDLAWHEYTHATMYRLLDNWFGPAGAILHLPWMEAWYLEGLAEAVSVSIGSDEQAGIERFQALTGNWPSWDRIHSLYSSGPFNYRGYATSGAFVTWIARKYGADKTPEFLKTLRNKTMPWYWPWAFTPFNGFWPMDSALQSVTSLSGKDLYELYKSEATRHWTALANGMILSRDVNKDETTSSPWEWTGGPGSEPRKIKAPVDSASFHIERVGTLTAYTEAYFPKANRRAIRIRVKNNATGKITALNRPQADWIDGPWISRATLTWHEYGADGSKICNVPVSDLKPSKARCNSSFKLPSHLRYLGVTRGENSEVRTIEFTVETENITGSHYSVMSLAPDDGTWVKNPWAPGGRPLSFATSSKGRWLLTGGDTWRYLVRVDESSRCHSVIRLNDFPVRILDSDTPLPHLVIYADAGFAARSIPEAAAEEMPCFPIPAHTSPLIEALRSPEQLSFDQAFAASDIWKRSAMKPDSDAEKNKTPPPLIEELNISHNAETKPVEQPAKWRGRPIFVFPWIGADDALGPQIGLISVPLMDEMQNETVRATMLVGVASRFPYQDVTLTSTRFEPTWSLGVFRAQTYNGRYRDRLTGLPVSGYLEEKGVHLDGSRDLQWKYLSIGADWGIKSSHLQKYIGPARRVGHLNEPYAGARMSVTNGGRLFAGLGLKGRQAPPGLNKVFHYDVLGASANAGTKVGDGKIELGVEGSRTRGPKRRDLQEMYQPLKTLIPGSGGGYNQTSYAVTEDYGLFTPVFGENQARGKLLATHPVIRDIDKFAGLVYLSHLDLSGFINYGTAWRNSELPKKSSLIAAQGYNLDLFLDNKGVNFNLGVGTGQVLGKAWQGYWTFGFDALF